MASASIRSTVTAPAPKPSVVGASRDDLAVGDTVSLESVNAGTGYSWSLAYLPEGSTSTLSGSPVAQNPGSFVVDREGPYLVRLQFTDNTGTTEQFVRLRVLTAVGSLKLVAAGEGVWSVPVPVDITFTGWADEQNSNLLTLLDLVKTQGTTERVLYVDPLQGDYHSIQAAINYAQGQGPTSVESWMVVVRPGIYQENLTFYSFVHVVGLPASSSVASVRIRNTSQKHVANLAVNGDTLSFENLYFENQNSASYPVLEVSGMGKLRVKDCVFFSGGAGNPQGPCLHVMNSVQANLESSKFSLGSGSSTGSSSIELEVGTSSFLAQCSLQVRGLWAKPGSQVSLVDTEVSVTGNFAVRSEASLLEMSYCHVSGGLLYDVALNPASDPVAGDLVAKIRWSKFGSLEFETSGIVGTTELLLGATEQGSLSFPSGAPNILAATVPASTLFYDNLTSMLLAENVQDALDEIWALAIEVTTLTDAYNGGTGGPSGSGRTIVANAGAVQIVDASSPADPIPAGNTNGNLEVVGSIKTGGINKPEQVFDPNPYGNGPLILLGREIWANDGVNGSSAFLLANSSGAPSYHNYNLRIGTKSANGGGFTGSVGRLILRGGDSLANTVTASSVYVQAGRGAHAGGGDGGNLYLAPGDAVGGVTGSLVLVKPSNGTSSSLTASGVFVGGVGGLIRFATDMGAIEVSVDVGDNLATVLGKFNSTGMVTAISMGGIINLTTTSLGPTSEVFYLNAEAGVDLALGGFSGQGMVPGTWPVTMGVQVTGVDEVSLGVGSSEGPLVYSGATGNLHIPSTLFLEETPIPVSEVDAGSVFVSDGSGGLIEGDLYYLSQEGSFPDTPVNLTLGSILAGTIHIQDEGVPLAGNYTTLNFIGSAINAVDLGGGVAGISVTGGSVLLISAEALLVGDLVQIDQSAGGRVLKSNAGVAGRQRVIGVSLDAVGAAGLPVRVLTTFGAQVDLLFDVAPVLGDQGSPVFLHTVSGQVSMSAPTSMGEVVLSVGILQDFSLRRVFFQPQFIALNP